LALANAIEDAGIERAKAESIATAIARFVEGNAATRADVQASETAVRTDLSAVKADIAGLRTELVRLDGKVEQIGQRTFNRLGTLVAVVAGILFAALHYWPPHG
jgi:hypothetical protein